MSAELPELLPQFSVIVIKTTIDIPAVKLSLLYFLTQVLSVFILKVLNYFSI
jgi:hypothetical protein